MKTRKITKEPPRGMYLPRNFVWRRCQRCRGWFAAHQEVEMKVCYACEVQAWLERRRR